MPFSLWVASFFSSIVASENSGRGDRLILFCSVAVALFVRFELELWSFLRLSAGGRDPICKRAKGLHPKDRGRCS